MQQKRTHNLNIIFCNNFSNNGTTQKFPNTPIVFVTKAKHDDQHVMGFKMAISHWKARMMWVFSQLAPSPSTCNFESKLPQTNDQFKASILVTLTFIAMHKVNVEANVSNNN